MQEADRDKVTVDDNEVNDEMTERLKQYGLKSQEDAERLLRAVSWVSRVNLDPWPSAGPFRVMG